MWLRRVDGGCLSYGAPALPAHLHLLPAPSFRFCAGDIDEYTDIFLDTEATKEAVIQAGIAIFQYIYHGPDTTLGEICYMFSRKAVAGVIKPETLPPTGCSCTACTLCLPADPGLDPSTEHVSEPQ